MQLPHVVSLGAQKNFNYFAVRLEERGKVNVDTTYFEHLIAKAILFKKTDKIIHGQKFGGYKAQIAYYTVSWLSHHTSQRIDLDTIWKNQDISPALEESIRTVSIAIHPLITNPPNGKNITEWCKRKECWEKIKELNVDISRLQNELIDISHSSNKRPDKGINTPNEEDIGLINAISEVPADKWFQISKWAKETNNLLPWQRGLAFSIGRVVGKSGSVSPKQAKQGIILLEEVKKLGFKL